MPPGLGRSRQGSDLTDEIPSAVQIAVPRASHTPQISFPPTKMLRFEPLTFELGLSQVEAAPGESVRIYDPERTVVDLMRLRHRAIAPDRRRPAGSWPGPARHRYCECRMSRPTRMSEPPAVPTSTCRTAHARNAGARRSSSPCTSWNGGSHDSAHRRTRTSSSSRTTCSSPLCRSADRHGLRHRHRDRQVPHGRQLWRPHHPAARTRGIPLLAPRP